MLVFKYFISGLLLLLLFGNYQEFNNASSNPQFHSDTVTSSIYKKHQGLIAEFNFKINLVDAFSKTPKTSFGPVKNMGLLNKNETYNHQLLYFKIGNTIPLQLTKSKLIFPFHCFT
jgi:hypothetical protein